MVKGAVGGEGRRGATAAAAAAFQRTDVEGMWTLWKLCWGRKTGGGLETDPRDRPGLRRALQLP